MKYNHQIIWLLEKKEVILQSLSRDGSIKFKPLKYLLKNYGNKNQIAARWS